jgi:hypothetical protein
MPRPRPNCRDLKEQSHELPRTETERRRYPAGFASAHLKLGIGIVLTSSERSQFVSHGRLSLSFVFLRATWVVIYPLFPIPFSLL